MAVKLIDVARRANVGCGTVSRVVNGDPHVSKATRDKVNKIISELGYYPNNLGKRLRTNKNNVVCVAVPIISHPFFNVVIGDLEKELGKKGYNMLLIASQNDIEKEKHILSKIRNKEVDGAIFITHNSHQQDEFKNLPIVSFDRHIRNDAPCVTTNNYEATKEAIEYLINKGASKIGYLGSKPNVDSEILLRSKAYIDVMNEHNMELRMVNIPINHDEEQKLVDMFLDTYKDVDGVFVAGYSLCECLITTLKQKGIKIPSQIQIVSYDGNFTKYSEYTATTMKQPIEEIAKCCVELVDQLIANKTDIKKKYIFNSKLEIGNTTR